MAGDHQAGGPPDGAVALPAEWEGLVDPEGLRFLSDHLSDERLRDVRSLLGQCPSGVGATLVAEIRTLIPGSQPDHALVLALARLTDVGG
jgi:hypothetical protein